MSAVIAGLRGVLPGGPIPETALRDRLRDAIGIERVLFTDSGTTALSLAMRGALRRKDGAIAVPAYGCYDLATAAEGAGARVALYDLDPHTLQPDLASLQSAAATGLSAVVVVHLFGLPVNIAAVASLADGLGAVVIEDAAQGVGALVHGRPAGTLGSMGVFSFGRGKGVTGGSGGALLLGPAIRPSEADAMADELSDGPVGIRDVVSLLALLALGRPTLYGIPSSLPWLGLGETVYREPRPLRRMSRVAMLALNRSWEAATAAVAVRRAHARRVMDGANAVSGLRFIREGAWGEPSYLRLPALAAPEVWRQSRGPAARRMGIMPGYPRALCDLEAFRHRCVNHDAEFHGARTLAKGIVTFPTHELLEESDLQDLTNWARESGI